jgi:hypothetical protein
MVTESNRNEHGTENGNLGIPSLWKGPVVQSFGQAFKLSEQKIHQGFCQSLSTLKLP